MSDQSGGIPSGIHENKEYLLVIDETEGTVLFHTLTQEIQHLRYQIDSYGQMDFPDEVVIGVGKSISALQWHFNQLLALRQKLTDLKNETREP